MLKSAFAKAFNRTESSVRRLVNTQSGRDLQRLLEEGSCQVVTMSMRPWDSSGNQRDQFIVDLIGVDELEAETAMVM